MFNPAELNPKATPKQKLTIAVLKLREQQFSVIKSKASLWDAVFNIEELQSSPTILPFNILLIKLQDCTSPYDYIRLLVDATRLREEQQGLHNQYFAEAVVMVLQVSLNIITAEMSKKEFDWYKGKLSEADVELIAVPLSVLATQLTKKEELVTKAKRLFDHFTVDFSAIYTEKWQARIVTEMRRDRYDSWGMQHAIPPCITSNDAYKRYLSKAPTNIYYRLAFLYRHAQRLSAEGRDPAPILNKALAMAGLTKEAPEGKSDSVGESVIIDLNLERFYEVNGRLLWDDYERLEELFITHDIKSVRIVRLERDLVSFSYQGSKSDYTVMNHILHLLAFSNIISLHIGKAFEIQLKNVLEAFLQNNTTLLELNYDTHWSNQNEEENEHFREEKRFFRENIQPLLQKNRALHEIKHNLKRAQQLWQDNASNAGEFIELLNKAKLAAERLDRDLQAERALNTVRGRQCQMMLAEIHILFCKYWEHRYTQDYQKAGPRSLEESLNCLDAATQFVLYRLDSASLKTIAEFYIKFAQVTYQLAEKHFLTLPATHPLYKIALNTMHQVYASITSINRNTRYIKALACLFELDREDQIRYVPGYYLELFDLAGHVITVEQVRRKFPYPYLRAQIDIYDERQMLGLSTQSLCVTILDEIKRLLEAARQTDSNCNAIDVLVKVFDNKRDLQWIKAKYKSLTNIFNTTFVSALEMEQPQEMKSQIRIAKNLCVNFDAHNSNQQTLISYLAAKKKWSALDCLLDHFNTISHGIDRVTFKILLTNFHAESPTERIRLQPIIGKYIQLSTYDPVMVRTLEMDKSPLYWCFRSRDNATFLMLLDKGLNVDVTNRDGMSLLVYMLVKQGWDFAEAVLSHPDARNYVHPRREVITTSLGSFNLAQYAVDNLQPNLLMLLLDHGLSPHDIETNKNSNKETKEFLTICVIIERAKELLRTQHKKYSQFLVSESHYSNRSYDSTSSDSSSSESDAEPDSNLGREGAPRPV